MKVAEYCSDFTVSVDFAYFSCPKVLAKNTSPITSEYKRMVGSDGKIVENTYVLMGTECVETQRRMWIKCTGINPLNIIFDGAGYQVIEAFGGQWRSRIDKFAPADVFDFIGSDGQSVFDNICKGQVDPILEGEA